METVETSSSSRVLYSFEYSARRQERKTTAAYTRPWRFYKKTHARTRGRSTSCWIADVIPPRHSTRITFVPLLSALVDEPTTPNPVTRKLSLNDLIHTNIAYIQMWTRGQAANFSTGLSHRQKILRVSRLAHNARCSRKRERETKIEAGSITTKFVVVWDRSTRSRPALEHLAPVRLNNC